jgi:hypothetical protein
MDSASHLQTDAVAQQPVDSVRFLDCYTLQL